MAAILDLYIQLYLVIFNGVSRRKFHTQLEHTILKCVTGQHLLFSKQIFFKFVFTAHAYFKPELLMVPYAFRILEQYYSEFH